MRSLVRLYWIAASIWISQSHGIPHNSSAIDPHPSVASSSTNHTTSSKTAVQNKEDRDDYPPGLSSQESFPKLHWYVIYLKGLQKTKLASVTDGNFSLDLRRSIASRLQLPLDGISLNKLVLKGNELTVNFSIGANPERQGFLERLTRLVSNDVMAFSGDRYIIFRVVKSDKYRALGLVRGLSYTHPYSHTVTLLQEDTRKTSEHERVELMFYLTVGGLCIFLFVLALSFLAIQFMKSGSLSYVDDEFDDEEEVGEDDNNESKELLHNSSPASWRLPCISSNSLDYPIPLSTPPLKKDTCKPEKRSIIPKWMAKNISSSKTFDLNI